MRGSPFLPLPPSRRLGGPAEARGVVPRVPRALSPLQGPVSFEEVAVWFSPEEWALLAAWQRRLYQEVMADNFELVASLGPQMHPEPELTCKMEQGGKLIAMDPPRQGGEDAPGTPLSAAQSPSVPDPAVKEEPWTPLASPERRASGADLGPSWRDPRPPDVGSAWQGPRQWGEGGGDSTEQGEVQICECGRSFEDAASLREHQACHTEERGPFVCPACGKLFQYRLNLLTHKKHRGKQQHSCTQCGLRFCLKGDLLRHRASHAAEGLHPCGACGLLFRRKRHLLAHKAEHAGDSPHRCGTCGVACGGEAELAAHQLFHAEEEERPFCCTKCGESFSWRESLQVHQRTHAQDRGHTCAVCGKTFSRPGNLLTHQRLHTGDLPFPCPDCGRSFPSKASLAMHCRFHQRSTPFACPECSCSFRSRDRLMEHQAAHGGTEQGPLKQDGQQ